MDALECEARRWTAFGRQQPVAAAVVDTLAAVGTPAVEADTVRVIVAVVDTGYCGRPGVEEADRTRHTAAAVLVLGRARRYVLERTLAPGC